MSLLGRERRKKGKQGREIERKGTRKKKKKKKRKIERERQATVTQEGVK